MAIKGSVFIATSLDGFIAREDGNIDWLISFEDPGDDEDHGFEEFMDSVDAMVMGRKTFEFIRSFEPWPYGKKLVFVLSSRKVSIPAKISKTVSALSGSPKEISQILERKGFSHLYVDGGKTIQGFMNENLIDQLTITKMPILIGSGIPLFGPIPHDIRLNHIETKTFKTGMVQSKYQVQKN